MIQFKSAVMFTESDIREMEQIFEDINRVIYKMHHLGDYNEDEIKEVGKNQAEKCA